MRNRNLSGHYAGLLLAAWHSNDTLLVRSAASQAEEAQPNAETNAGELGLEQERLEMVQSAAAVLRRSTFQPGQEEDIAAALRLLSHIANHAPTEAPLRARRASGQR